MGNHALLKQINKLLILKTILDNKMISRAKISRLVDLNKATVSNLTDELIKEGYIVEKGYGKSKGGRRPVLLQVNKDVGSIIGIDLGVDYIHVILSNFIGEIIFEEYVNIKMEEPKEKLLNLLFDMIEKAIDKAPPTPKGILGIGIGVPGIVEKESGIVLIAPNLKWKNVHLKSIIEQRFNLPVYIDNEANAGALGEKWFGEWGKVSDLIYLSVGIGLGAGIIIDNKLFRGAAGFAGEVGHTTINFQDDVCSCGNIGCLENFASERALLSVIKKLVKEGAEDRYISCENVDEITPSQIIQAAMDGSRICRMAVLEVAEKMAIGIANLVNIFNPEIVIVGNKASFFGDLFLEKLREVVNQKSFIAQFYDLKIEVSKLKDRAVVLGCIAMVISDMLSFPEYV
ncbi:ROK family protein [Caldicellulosiruptor obsidiansis OB47]|uniref:ROK family protein n=1 Tax=Caldicellulosiruptor obsidiansis (strain ATCC BAA-2073 / JCM 16842 / OB47) TaxID=608506 RepID=D9TIQ8_CALOO|nr:ROK family transcriptional regulator [Caldicellulosiruptor obsidiansis]ADL41890.1 ROK family protein [Caldicellulosiruptor obsidiansis OB47]